MKKSNKNKEICENQLLEQMRTAILRWYPLIEESEILLLYSRCQYDPWKECRESVYDFLKANGFKVDKDKKVERRTDL